MYHQIASSFDIIDMGDSIYGMHNGPSLIIEGPSGLPRGPKIAKN